jgi:regulator of protease activity HflC (stomatin/prohibitin superfamily)
MFVLLLLLAVAAIGVAIGSCFAPKKSSYGTPMRSILRLAAGALAVLAVVVGLFSTIYTQRPGEAKVILNWGGGVADVDTTPGISFKAPWQSASTWDLLSQTATYAGDDKAVPAYTEGNIQGKEITVSLAKGVQGDIDAQITYSLDADKATLTDLYNRFRSQESFTRQIIQTNNLSEMREGPKEMDAVTFRGEGRASVEQSVKAALNDIYRPYGVTVSQVTIQGIRFSDSVEASIQEAAAAAQRQVTAQANLAATQIDAQAQVVQAEQAAKAAVAKAQGEADANALLAASLTPQVLQQHYIDALKAGTVFVVPEGSNPLVQVPSGH